MRVGICLNTPVSCSFRPGCSQDFAPLSVTISNHPAPAYQAFTQAGTYTYEYQVLEERRKGKSLNCDAWFQGRLLFYMGLLSNLTTSVGRRQTPTDEF